MLNRSSRSPFRGAITLGATLIVSSAAALRAQTPALSGRVIDAHGAPVVGATAHVRGTRNTVTTDGAGRFTIDGLAPGRYVVAIQRIGFAADSAAVRIPTATALEFRLKTRSTVRAGVLIEASPRLNETREGGVASLLISVTRQAQIQLQELDLNNEVFGFFNGVPRSVYTIQHEVYGRSFIAGVRVGF